MSILPWTKYVQKPYIKIANLKIDGSTQVLRDEWREESLGSPGKIFHYQILKYLHLQSMASLIMKILKSTFILELMKLVMLLITTKR